jgi:hypothetical protein
MISILRIRHFEFVIDVEILIKLNKCWDSKSESVNISKQASIKTIILTFFVSKLKGGSSW